MNIAFITHSLPEDRTLKVILRGVPTDITEEEFKVNLSCHGFNVVLVKTFGLKDKPFPICLVIIKKNPAAIKMYDITNIFYISIKVEAHKQTDPTQRFSCQNFGHGSQNYHNTLRCVKFSETHKGKECILNLSSKFLCCNCGGDHTTIFRDCPWYKHVISITTPTSTEHF